MEQLYDKYAKYKLQYLHEIIFFSLNLYKISKVMNNFLLNHIIRIAL